MPGYLCGRAHGWVAGLLTMGVFYCLGAGGGGQAPGHLKHTPSTQLDAVVNFQTNVITSFVIDCSVQKLLSFAWHLKTFQLKCKDNSVSWKNGNPVTDG